MPAQHCASLWPGVTGSYGGEHMGGRLGVCMLSEKMYIDVHIYTYIYMNIYIYTCIDVCMYMHIVLTP